MITFSVEKQALRIVTELKALLCARLLDGCSEMDFRSKRRALLEEFQSLHLLGLAVAGGYPLRPSLGIGERLAAKPV